MMIAFAALAALMTVSALGVVLCSNPIYSAIWLITNLLGVSALFAMLDAHFLAVVQIIVYAGAIMVLFLFVVMLLNLKAEQPKRRSVVYQMLAWGSGIGFAVLLGRVFTSAFKGTNAIPVMERFVPAVEGTTKAFGEVLYTRFVFTFEAASLLIIAAILGAVMLAKRRYRASETLAPVKEV
ncbi:MAG: NADH-quinone oxidoreductase subunit J [Proteobacteria bacterium]|nr:NADH-quinone oxidoreductase subunit J [Pseudomonadota bacterium]